MKFKARVASPLSLQRIVAALEKLNRHAILKLTQRRTWLICRGEILDGTQIWVELPTVRLSFGFRWCGSAAAEPPSLPTDRV